MSSIDTENVSLATQVEELTLALRNEQEQLLNIQTTLRQMVDQPDNIEKNLEAVAASLRTLGWQRVILAVLSDIGDINRLITAGLSREEEQAYRQGVIPETIRQRLMNGELESYRLGGMYFIPAGVGPVWDVRDLLFAPLRLGQAGELGGFLRLEQPANGQRPLRESLRPVDILASQTAFVVANERSARVLEDQVEELSMMHRADREISSHLDVERVMTLTMDWALRRTGADTGLLMLMTDDNSGLVPSITMGYVDHNAFPYSRENPMPVSQGIMGRVARTGQTQVVHDGVPEKDDVPFLPGAQSHLSVPLAMRGEVLGVVTLASMTKGIFKEKEVSFLERLSRRAAVALDNSRLFRQAEQMADDMAVLYSASRAITSTLERDEVLQRIAQAMAVSLECSSAIVFDYQAETEMVQVLAVYRVGTALGAKEVLPEVRQRIKLSSFPALQTAVKQQHPLVLRVADPAISVLDRERLEKDNLYTMALLPLIAQNELIGVAAVVEGRRDRIFSPSEMFKAEALASQASVALRQSMLFSEILDLEKIKSEMIRMASHDLRNPLNNIMGYIELLALSMTGVDTTPDQELYIDTLRRNTKSMRTLLEDLLTLERIESERQSDWNTFDPFGLVFEVVESQRSSAALKNHTLTLECAPDLPEVRGSETQLRQAVANLIGNAIKYTPDNGVITVHLVHNEGRLQLSVKDNGYGISSERQARIFERFYRAREPGTDHIGGTGLGLSLVKTVVERHGGQVWFESEVGAGSTFGFWVPIVES